MSAESIKAEPLTDGELHWLTEQRATCALLVDQLLKRSGQTVPTVTDLHHAYDVWLTHFISPTRKRSWFTKKSPPIDPNSIALSLGVVLGDHIAAETLLEWMIVTDSYGTDLMLYAPGQESMHTDITTAPINMVAKRIESRTSDWITTAYNAVCDELQRMTT